MLDCDAEGATGRGQEESRAIVLYRKGDRDEEIKLLEGCREIMVFQQHA